MTEIIESIDKDHTWKDFKGIVVRTNRQDIRCFIHYRPVDNPYSWYGTQTNIPFVDGFIGASIMSIHDGQDDVVPGGFIRDHGKLITRDKNPSTITRARTVNIWTMDRGLLQLTAYHHQENDTRQTRRCLIAYNGFNSAKESII
jgi:hypothetical protein